MFSEVAMSSAISAAKIGFSEDSSEIESAILLIKSSDNTLELSVFEISVSTLCVLAGSDD